LVGIHVNGVLALEALEGLSLLSLSILVLRVDLALLVLGVALALGLALMLLVIGVALVILVDLTVLDRCHELHVIILLARCHILHMVYRRTRLEIDIAINMALLLHHAWWVQVLFV
jgi:hypothetical protein